MSQQPFEDVGDLLAFSPPTVSYTIPSVADDSNTQSSTTVYDRYYSFPSSSSSSDDDEPSSSSAAAVSAASKRLEYNLQFLDRKLSSSSPPPNHPLPEFAPALAPGSDPFFAPPIRASDFSVPPCLELRPQPLRETQVGRYLRTVVSIENELWAGTECGVRVWRFNDMYKMGNCGEEEGTAPYFESEESSGVMCMVGDEGNKLVWTGHRDGRIRVWKMGQTNNGFREILSWQVSRSPIVSIVLSYYGASDNVKVTSSKLTAGHWYNKQFDEVLRSFESNHRNFMVYDWISVFFSVNAGDIWSCSESDFIKVWPWETIEKALSMTKEERHLSALLVERSYIDLRSQVTDKGYLNASTSDTKHLLSDLSRAKVWSAGYLAFGLWDARTRELLKLFNIEGQIENRLEMSSVQEFAAENEIKMKFGGPRKDKQQNPISFFQRSRNAIMGAADAVFRVATKGAFGDDNRKIEALEVTINGMVWAGCYNGSLVQWDGNGNRLQEFQYHTFSVQSICSFGSRIWIGYASGIVQVLDLEGNLVGEWVAHKSPVISMAVGVGYLFTLARHGGVRGWNIASPCPLDSILHSELAGKEFLYTRLETLKILAGTWNVAQERASHDSLITWLGAAALDVGIVVVGLQEVEMGAGVLAISAARETVGLEGSALGQWWLDMIGKTLDEGLTFERVGSRQLAGLLIGVWVRDDIRANVGDVDAAAVPCGFGRAIGNKGAVGLRMRVYDKIFSFINCHFAAHLEAVSRRNADFDRIYRTMTFTRPSNSANTAAVGLLSTAQILRNTSLMGTSFVDGKPELSEADMVVFLGDFNYRLDGISYDEARDFISQRSFDWLREKDQLRAEMKEGNVFQGMREAIIKFPPTYKFDKNQLGLAGYDSSEKKRIPAWCDRILYRDSRSSLTSDCSLECPVAASISQYESCMDVTDSDHKPVRCIFNVQIARVDESVRRQEFGEIIASNEKVKYNVHDLSKIPDVIVSTSNIILQNQDTSILRITNRSANDSAFFEIICEGETTIGEDGQAHDHCPRGSFGFPRWLEVTPASGIIKPDHIMEVTVHHEDRQTVEEFVDGVPQNWWCEDNSDAEVILVVRVHGRFSSDTKNHRVRVRHCYPIRTAHSESNPNNSKEVQGNVGNLLHRSDIRWLSSSYEVVDKLKNLHSP